MATQAWQFIFFTVGPSVPSDLVMYMGGSSSSSSPTVNLDFHFVGFEGTARSFVFKQQIRNAIWRRSTKGDIYFPVSGGGSPVKVAEKKPFHITFNYDYCGKSPAKFQNSPIMRAGGRIDYSSSYAPAAAGYSSRIGTQITPVHSFKGNRIWKVAITFVS